MMLKTGWVLMPLIPDQPPQAIEPVPADVENLVGRLPMTHGQLQRLATLHRRLRLATAIADALMPIPGDDPYAMVERHEVTRWVEAVAEADTAYEALQKYRCDVGWPAS